MGASCDAIGGFNEEVMAPSSFVGNPVLTKWGETW